MLESLIETIDAGYHARRNWDFLVSFWEQERWFDTPHQRAAAELARNALEEAGLSDVRLASYPADGKTRLQDWIMHMAWDCPSARLAYADSGEALADREKVQAATVYWCGPLASKDRPAVGEVVDGDALETITPQAVNGKFVLTAKPPAETGRRTRARGTGQKSSGPLGDLLLLLAICHVPVFLRLFRIHDVVPLQVFLQELAVLRAQVGEAGSDAILLAHIRLSIAVHDDCLAAHGSLRLVPGPEWREHEAQGKACQGRQLAAQPAVEASDAEVESLELRRLAFALRRRVVELDQQTQIDTLVFAAIALSVPSHGHVTLLQARRRPRAATASPCLFRQISGLPLPASPPRAAYPAVLPVAPTPSTSLPSALPPGVRGTPCIQ